MCFHNKAAKHICCDINDNRKIIKTIDPKGESKSTHIIENPNHKVIQRLVVDGCFIKNGLKCDFLIIDSKDKQVYFIELKGDNLIHAINQIDSTIEAIKVEIVEYSINAHVVLSKVRTPDIMDSRTIRFVKKINKLNGDFRKETKQMIVKI